MGGAEKFCLRWNDFESNISGAFRELREDKDFFDVTLSCDDDQLQAHKVILSACSPFFRTILRRNKHEHPLLYLKGVKYTDLVSVLNFMYHGEVNVAQDELNSFLAVAEDLKVKGLTQGSSESKSQSSFKSEPSKQYSENPRQPARSESLYKRPTNPIPTRIEKATTVKYQPVEDDDDILEVVPIKREPTSQPPPATQKYTVAVEPAYPTPQMDPMTTAVVADLNSMEYGEDYADYGYADAREGYDAGAGEAGGGQDGNKDLDALILDSMSQVVSEVKGTCWQCNHCGKQDKDKKDMRRHVESHYSFSHTCPHCEKIYKSRPSLKSHISAKHKDVA